MIADRLGSGSAAALSSLLRELDFANDETVRLDTALKALASQERYASVLSAVKHKGVGLVTGLAFLTEIGPMSRFHNRRQLASFLGLTPRSNESGQCSDRKGHITRQGPARLRRLLCQAVWSLIRNDPAAALEHAALMRGDPRRKRLATVAMMRRLAIRLWHEYGAAQAAAAERRAEVAQKERVQKTVVQEEVVQEAVAQKTVVQKDVVQRKGCSEKPVRKSGVARRRGPVYTSQTPREGLLV